MRGRVNYRNLARYSDYSERTYARQFQRSFPWLAYHAQAIQSALPPAHELIAMNKSARYKQRPLITATEVGEFVYCAKAWQLKRDGFVAHSSHLEPGRTFHAQHGAQLALAGRLRQVSLACALAAGLLLIGLLAWYLARA